MKDLKMLRAINEYLQELNSFIDLMEQRLRTIPEGRIKVRNGVRTPKVYVLTVDNYGTPKEQYIQQNDVEKISKFAEKKYYSDLLPAMQKEANEISRFLRRYNGDEKNTVFDNLNPFLKQYVNPLFAAPEEVCRSWEAEPYEGNTFPFYDEGLLTSKGEHVRSKAEYIIAEKLYSRGIAYKYEAPLVLPDGHVTYPDFTIMHPLTNELYYLEYFGLMADEVYLAKCMNKLSRYAREPMYTNLISIFEHPDAPFNASTIDRILYNYFGV